ncbi:MAG: GGDEF domain-containing protein [Planctomycetaceae bacterium]|nr:GGDEF domain-containing protein [Planctomycetales bacterium]MCB9926302.1 GGDEF domain-containing protein [Planctomycetaceae bacterium]
MPLHIVLQARTTVHFGALDLQPQPLPAKRAFLSVIRSRADLGINAFIEGPTLLGRNPGCSFPLHDFGVSWEHATITPRGNDEFVLEDLNSTNGTRVNGKPISSPRVLRDGDKIFAGETVVRFSLADEMEIDFHSEIAALVGTDPLTGLESKRRFDQAFEFALRTAKERGGSLALLMMDMDGVKQINDTHGHLFGAHVIGETGRLIARALGSSGRACRFGGDEFCAFLPGRELNAACDMAEQIRRAVETAGMEKDGIPLKPTISIGVACYPEAASELSKLISVADDALYRAKRRGKNCVAG